MSQLGIQGIFQLLLGFWGSRLIYTGVSLGVFDQLSNEGKSAEELSSEIGTNPEALYRILRALSNYKLVDESEDHKFTLNEDGAFLRDDHPQSLRGATLLELCPEHTNTWNYLNQMATDGPEIPAFNIAYGMPVFDYLGTHPKYAATFGPAMTSLSKMEMEKVVEILKEGHYLVNADIICDIGGGYGFLLNGILEKAAKPDAKGIVGEIPAVINDIDSGNKEAAHRENLEFVEIDMFEEVVPADTYILKHILHDWPDEKCIQILKVARKAAKPGATIIVYENVITSPNVPSFAKLMDVHMMLMAGGRERTQEEFQSLYASTGWKLDRVVNVGNLSLVMGSTD